MTHEELVKRQTENKILIEKYKAEIKRLENINQRLSAEHTAEHIKFHDGEMVHYLKEKYKVPRKYFIKSHCAFIHYIPDGSYEFSVLYELESKNGRKPNDGWLIPEEDLVSAEKS